MCTPLNYNSETIGAYMCTTKVFDLLLHVAPNATTTAPQQKNTESHTKFFGSAYNKVVNW